MDDSILSCIKTVNLSKTTDADKSEMSKPDDVGASPG